MAEMMNELKEFEDEFFAIRCQLRQLSGKVGLFASIEHERSVKNMRSANNRSADAMLKDITYALTKLDEYEYQRDYFFEREAGWERIYESSFNTGKGQDAKHRRNG